jgi:hypothetical protein
VSTTTVVIILGCIILMVITASILQAADKKKRERQRQTSLLKQRTTLLQELLIDDSNSVLTPRLRLMVLHKLRALYNQLATLHPSDPHFVERIDQVSIMMGAIQPQLNEPFAINLPTTQAGLSDAKSTFRTLGKLLNNMIDAKSVSPKDAAPLKMDIQHGMLEMQIQGHEMAAKEALQEQRYSVVVHNLTTALNLLQRSNRPDRKIKIEEYQALALEAQQHMQAVTDAKARQLAKQQRDWQDLAEEDGIFKKKHAYDD